MLRTTFITTILTVICSAAIAQQEQPDNAVPPELEVEGASNDSGDVERRFGTITIGSRRWQVHKLLGRPTFESVIPSTRRRIDQFADGTEVTYVESKTISVRPSGSATRDAMGNYFVKRESVTATISPIVVRQCGIYCEDKCRIEESFWYKSPIFIPSIYDGVPFTPPMFDSSMINAYLRGLSDPHIQSTCGCDQCRCSECSKAERPFPIKDAPR